MFVFIGYWRAPPSYDVTAWIKFRQFPSNQSCCRLQRQFELQYLLRAVTWRREFGNFVREHKGKICSGLCHIVATTCCQTNAKHVSTIWPRRYVTGHRSCVSFVLPDKVAQLFPKYDSAFRNNFMRVPRELRTRRTHERLSVLSYSFAYDSIHFKEKTVCHVCSSLPN